MTVTYKPNNVINILRHKTYTGIYADIIKRFKNVNKIDSIINTYFNNGVINSTINSTHLSSEVLRKK